MMGGLGGCLDPTATVLYDGSRAKKREHSEEKPRTDSATAQGWWKNTGVLGLGFIPTRTKRRAQTRETKQAIDLVLVNHKKDPGDAD
jgi:hypothetical protein